MKDETVTSFSYHSKSDSIFTTSQNLQFRVWKDDQVQQSWKASAHRTPASSCAFDPSGTLVATGEVIVTCSCGIREKDIAHTVSRVTRVSCRTYDFIRTRDDFFCSHARTIRRFACGILWHINVLPPEFTHECCDVSELFDRWIHDALSWTRQDRERVRTPNLRSRKDDSDVRIRGSNRSDVMRNKSV